MNTDITTLNPPEIWKNFSSICAIPHPSKHEEALTRFIEQRGQELGLETMIDEVGNIIIRKPATPGFENRKTVTLQSHIDMVPQKNSSVDHDFSKDPIIPYIDGEWVTAQDTTLGADNGIGVASILAVLESTTLEHGPIEALFTTDEETGMTGAFGLKPGILKGDIMLNLDSEDEGELYIGCAGGVNTVAEYHYTQSETAANHLSYELELTGFKGGHSGVDIHLQRGNPAKELSRLLLILINECDAQIHSVNGGTLRNAIPREAFAQISVCETKLDPFKAAIESFGSTLEKELHPNIPNLKIALTQADFNPTAIDPLEIKEILKAIIACPDGVLRMSTELEGIVESSSNMGIITTSDELIKVCTLQRASHDSLKSLAAERIRHLFELSGAQVTHSGEYPGWVPCPDSEILSIMKQPYHDLFNQEPKVLVIHAGLECGLIHSKYPHMEMISFGPTIRFPHSPDEKVNIATVQTFWEYLTKVLTEIPLV